MRVIIHIKVSSGCISRILSKTEFFTLAHLKASKPELSKLEEKFHFSQGKLLKKERNYFEEDANYLWVSLCLSLLSGSGLGDVTLFLFLCS